MPIGAPGWPELAALTASRLRNLIALESILLFILSPFDRAPYASIRLSGGQKGTTIRRVLSDEQKKLGVKLLYVYENKVCELISYDDDTINTKILNEVLY